MRKIALLTLLVALAGCAVAPRPAGYGSFATASDAIDKQMVDDTVKKLVTLYPPAGTRFELQHGATDPFGTSLVATLRERGYALQEHMSASMSGADDKGKSRTLAYVFDQPPGTDLYRVTLTIDAQSLSRVYLAKDGSVAPAGYWVRKE
jgi:hypothetical protein